MNLTPAIILIIVAAIVGYVLGIVDSRITASLKKKSDENAAASAAAAAQPAAEERNRLGEHTVLKVTIDQTLKWHLELDEARQDDPSAVSPEQRQRLINIITQIRPWIDGKTAQSNAPVQAAQPAPEPIPARTVSPVVQAQAAASSNTAPKVDVMRGLRSLLTNDVKAPGFGKNSSIVAMIDEVLQAKLLGTSLLSQAIRLEEGAMGEVIVFVGRNSYNGVDAVPDPEIRAIIKSAISDWEKK